MELGPHGELDSPLLQSFLNSCFSDTVFVTLLSTAVETAISGVTQVAWHWRGPHLLSIGVQTVADRLSVRSLLIGVSK